MASASQWHCEGCGFKPHPVHTYFKNSMKTLIKLSIFISSVFILLTIYLILIHPVFATESALCSVSLNGIELTPKDSLPSCTSINVGELGFKIPSLGDILTFTIRAFFVVAGLMALFYLLLGALAWITSGGDKDAVTAARDKIQAAVVGLLLIVAVLAIIWTLEQVIFNRRICLGLSCPLTLPGLIKPDLSQPFCCVCVDGDGNRTDRINGFTDSCVDGAGKVVLPAPTPTLPPEIAGQLGCDSGIDPYNSNTMRILNNSNETINNISSSVFRCKYEPDKVKKGFYKCEACEGDSANDPNCQKGTFDEEWSIPKFSLAPGESKIVKIQANPCEIIQVDVYNTDAHVDDSPLECFNARSKDINPPPPSRWPGGIAFMINQNDEGYDAATGKCIVPTATQTATPTERELPESGK